MDSANLLFEIEKKFVLDLGFEGEHKQKVLIWGIKTQSNQQQQKLSMRSLFIDTRLNNIARIINYSPGLQAAIEATGQDHSITT